VLAGLAEQRRGARRATASRHHQPPGVNHAVRVHRLAAPYTGERGQHGADGHADEL
jgi:hypothetical protein